MNAIKNAFKITVRRFSVVWKILLFNLIVTILLVSVNLSVLLPFINAISEEVNIFE